MVVIVLEGVVERSSAVEILLVELEHFLKFGHAFDHGIEIGEVFGEEFYDDFVLDLLVIEVGAFGLGELLVVVFVEAGVRREAGRVEAGDCDVFVHVLCAAVERFD